MDVGLPMIKNEIKTSFGNAKEVFLCLKNKVLLRMEGEHVRF